MNEEANIHQIKKCLNKIEQNSLFAPKNEFEEFTLACCAYLKDLGYRVSSPMKPKFKVKNTNELRRLFYGCYEKYISPNYRPGTNSNKELGIFKRLINNRLDDNINKERALEESALIIETVFKHKDEFKFKYAITPETIGTDWVINKAIDIINRESEINAEKEYDRRMKKFNDADAYDAESVLNKLKFMGD